MRLKNRAINRFRLPTQQQGHRPLARRLRRLSTMERRAEAGEFIRLFYHESGAGGASPVAKSRMAEVDAQIKRTGTYAHTPDELTFGARVAWRNHARCIGRLYWQSLEVFDRRDVTDVDAVFEATQDHMRRALSDGRIRSVITVFAPATPQDLPVHFESGQICRYAGYVDRAGKTTGDRRHHEATRIARADGWKGQGGAFDMLPVAMIDADGRRVHRTLDDGLIKRVPLRHPDHPAFDQLGLEWYAVPCISDMILTIGGIDYPCAPFNGFYMGTEIASRNLVDPWRYGLLEEAADAFGLCADKDDALWPDKTLTELNAAVIGSFARECVTLVDHHSAGRQFAEFRAREQAAGRTVHANWGWTVPPQAGAVSPPFHMELQDAGNVPNYYNAWSSDGRGLRPYRHDQYLGRFGEWLERQRRRQFLRRRGIEP